MQPSFDCAAIALIHLAMHQNRSLVLHGPLSRTLAENLEEFQLAWRRWAPNYYQVVQIFADELTDDGQSSAPDAPAVAAFSGGVDGSFTVWRHLNKKPGQHHKNIRAAAIIQGFDIPLEQNDAFAQSVKGARAMFEGIDCHLVVLRTNLRSFLPHWELNFGAGLAACLHSLPGAFRYGLMGSDEAYDQLVIPWGSNPITTPLLSSARFRVIYDGTGYTRTERCFHIGNWRSAMNHLRVCWEGPITGKNCCKCEKCIRTILNFRAAGLPRPEAFEHDVTDEQIRNMKFRNEAQRNLIVEIYQTARAKGVDESWVDAVRDLLNHSK
jgi:hypothetical protein